MFFRLCNLMSFKSYVEIQSMHEPLFFTDEYILFDLCNQLQGGSSHYSDKWTERELFHTISISNLEPVYLPCRCGFLSRFSKIHNFSFLLLSPHTWRINDTFYFQ